MVFRGAHGVSAHQFHTKWCRLIVATSVYTASHVELLSEVRPAVPERRGVPLRPRREGAAVPRVEFWREGASGSVVWCV